MSSQSINQMVQGLRTSKTAYRIIVWDSDFSNPALYCFCVFYRLDIHKENKLVKRLRSELELAWKGYGPVGLEIP